MGEYDQTVYDDPDHAGREGNRDPYGMLVGGYGISLVTPPPSSS
ncbi:MAG: hypothetical protein ACLSAF_19600 [Intestinimonas sp.]